MNSLTKYWVLTAVAALGLVGSAQASTLQFIVTDAQIEAAVTASTFSSNCTATLSNCGIYGIGFISDSLSATGATAVSNTVGTSTDQWVSFIPNTGNKAGFEAGDATGATIAFLTTNTSLLTTGSYNTDTGLSLIGAAAANTPSLSTGTSGGHNGELVTTTSYTFDVTYSGNQAPASDTITLQLVADVLNSNGTEGNSNKGLLGTVNVVETLTATPEPSSMVLMFGGLLAIATSRLRRLRRATR